ncbi:MAG: 2-dehydropantoate 2-reductase, partial [Deltaproteobacteria bacterium]|nr:2-dehydropantoate 2-reductase [Deltaproteobacteria bacterium]
AITKLKNGRLPDIEGTRHVMEKAIDEAVRVADLKGIKLPFSDPMERVLEVCRGTADNIASMLQDVMAERATEIQFINGAIVAEGQRLGVPTPVNFTLSCLVAALQDSYQEVVTRS